MGEEYILHCAKCHHTRCNSRCNIPVAIDAWLGRAMYCIYTFSSSMLENERITKSKTSERGRLRTAEVYMCVNCVGMVRVGCNVVA